MKNCAISLIDKIPMHTPKKINIKFSDKATEAKMLSIEKAKSIISMIITIFQKEFRVFLFFKLFDKLFFFIKK